MRRARANLPEAQMMKIVNKSSFSLKKIRPLLRFVLRYTRYSGLAILHLEDGHGKHLTGGASRKIDDNLDTYEPATPTRVDIYLGAGDLSYPVRDTYVPGLPVRLDSWEEEVLLVIAHELRHVDQFWKREKPDRSLEEADAELFAITVLNEYRAERAP